MNPFQAIDRAAEDYRSNLNPGAGAVSGAGSALRFGRWLASTLKASAYEGDDTIEAIEGHLSDLRQGGCGAVVGQWPWETHKIREVYAEHEDPILDVCDRVRLRENPREPFDTLATARLWKAIEIEAPRLWIMAREYMARHPARGLALTPAAKELLRWLRKWNYTPGDDPLFATDHATLSSCGIGVDSATLELARNWLDKHAGPGLAAALRRLK